MNAPRPLTWAQVCAIIYAREVRRLRGWPPAKEWLCPWLWEMNKRYWYD